MHDLLTRAHTHLGCLTRLPQPRFVYIDAYIKTHANDYPCPHNATVADELVHTCKKGKLTHLKKFGDTCQSRAGGIVGCPIGCLADARKLCVWEKTSEKCVESMRPSPGEMVPKRQKRCSFNGFTAPIMADSAYDCQVDGWLVVGLLHCDP